FHPNTNEKTVFLKTADLLCFLDGIGFTYEILEL
ncbi:prolyl-tRNA synthetase associated domain-containing protein, partial [Streptococcus pyogenes]